MSVVWMDGFEIDPATFTARKYQSVVGTVGGGAGRLQGGSASCNGVAFTTPSLGSDQTYTIGFGLNTTAGWGTFLYVTLMAGGVEQFTLTFTANREVQVRRGTSTGTILQTGTTQLPAGNWSWIEFKVTLDSSGSPTVGSYEVRINTILEFVNAGPVQTAATVSSADQVRWSAPSGGTALWDDIYVLNSNSSGANDFLGDQVIEGLQATGPGASTQWSVVGAAQNWDAVTDTTSPNDGDYITSDTNGHIDYYEFENIAFITGSINAVAFSFGARMELAASSRQVRGRFRDSLGNSGPFATKTVNGTTPATQLAILEEDPTSAMTPWAISEINNGQFGMEVVA